MTAAAATTAEAVESRRWLALCCTIALLLFACCAGLALPATERITTVPIQPME